MTSSGNVDVEFQPDSRVVCKSIAHWFNVRSFRRVAGYDVILSVVVVTPSPIGGSETEPRLVGQLELACHRSNQGVKQNYSLWDRWNLPVTEVIKE